jgi:zinc transporter 5/7
MYGVFLHILADALGSVGVIFSSILVKYYNMYVADPICSFIISLMILGSVVPLITMTANNLMMKTPSRFINKRSKLMKKMA